MGQRGVVTRVGLSAVDTTVSVNPFGAVGANDWRVSWVMLTWMNMGTPISRDAFKPNVTIVIDMADIDR